VDDGGDGNSGMESIWWVRCGYLGGGFGLVLLVLYDLPRVEYGICSDFRRVLFDKDVIRFVSFLLRIDCNLSNDSEEYVSIRFRIKKECEICN